MKMTITRLQEILIDQEETLSKIRHDFYQYEQFNKEQFDNKDEQYEKELENNFKKSWDKCDKIIKKRDPFREKHLQQKSNNKK